MRRIRTQMTAANRKRKSKKKPKPKMRRARRSRTRRRTPSRTRKKKSLKRPSHLNKRMKMVVTQPILAR